METKECFRCHVVKSTSEFYTNCGKIYNICKSCENKRKSEYRNTQKGFFMCILRNAKLNASNKYIVEARSFNLTLEDINELWNKQKGLCYYSYIPMITKVCSKFKMSIQRLDDTKGYIKENVVLCCIEFNNATKWTHDKINKLFEPFEDILVNFELIIKPPRLPIKVIKTIVDGIEYYTCTHCNIPKVRDDFYKDICDGCKSCSSIRNKERNATPRGHMQLLVCNARSHTKARKERKIKNTRESDFDIDFDYLVSLYHKQNRRCAYSNAVLQFGHYKNTDWLTSLERINSLKGYTKDNVCLIALEFNTSDRKCMTNDETVEGSSAWSKEKFEYFKKVYLENRSAIEA
jgi:hypothetical protein